MTVMYHELSGLNPHAFTDAAGQLATCARKLGDEYRQFQTQVVRPLQRESGWRGGGQPDASVVARVNGLAIDTMRLRVAVGSLAYVYMFVGMTKAQQELTTLVRQVAADGLEMDDGEVQLPWFPTSRQASKKTEHALRLEDILAFATKVDAECARRLRDGDDLPLTTQTAAPGLLERATKEHADAVGDIQQAADSLDGLIAAAARAGVPFDEGAMPDVRSLIPAGAATAAASAGVRWHRLALPPKRGPHYDEVYDLGKSRHSPEELFAILRRRFGELFPIKGAPSTLRVGQRVDLWPVVMPPGQSHGARMHFPVVVSRVTKTGWTFNTLPGHPDYPGKVTFDFTRGSDGRTRLHIRGTCGPCGTGLYQLATDPTWKPFRENMRRVAGS